MKVVSSLYTVLLALAWSASFVRGEWHFWLDWNHFPGFRFTPWNSLPDQVQNYALTAGYTEETWDAVGTAPLEKKAWSELDDTTQNALEDLGFEETTWDCYMNHYNAYSWVQLIVKNKHKQVEMLGWSQVTWDSGNDGSVLSDSTPWEDLEGGQQRAAAALCYWEDTWMPGQVLDDFTSTPTKYPWFRYQMWDYLTPQERGLATTAGWTEDTWNLKDGVDSENAAMPFADLLETTRQAMMDMGFYEEQYDCWVNHYEGYTWEELVTYELNGYFEAFGFNSDNFMKEGASPPDAYQADWDELTDHMKNAAYHLCWFQELWDEEPVAEWFDEDQPFPYFRFVPWEKLTDHDKNLAALAGYDRSAWNMPGSEGSPDRKSFDLLSNEQQDAMQALGFYSADQYDCVSQRLGRFFSVDIASRRRLVFSLILVMRFSPRFAVGESLRFLRLGRTR